jgi:hypothetical protein
MLLMMKLETIEHARFRALSQIIIDQEKGVEAFEEYMKLAFPYLEAVQTRDKQKLLDELKREVKRGPMMIRPLPELRARSQLKARSEKRKRTREENNALYSKLRGIRSL